MTTVRKAGMPKGNISIGILFFYRKLDINPYKSGRSNFINHNSKEE
jgi:hypothetical protein